jgi:hypothetical protein
MNTTEHRPVDAHLLFRLTDGQLFKQYTNDIPEWAATILK